MKTLVRTSLAIAAFGLLFTSCGDDDEAESVDATVSTTGTISGQVTYADTIGATAETPLSGVTIHAIIDMEDVALNHDSAYDYNEESFTTETDGAGEYEFDIKAGAKSVTITLEGNDTRMTQVRAIPGGDTTTVVDNLLEMDNSGRSVTIRKGQHKVVDLTYSAK